MKSSIQMMEPLESRQFLSAVTFTINQTKSFATLSGASVNLSPQAKNSLKAFYSGTIGATVTSTSIKFTSARAKPIVTGKWQPTPGKKTAYGGIAKSAYYSDLAGLVFSVSSKKAIAISGGKFSPSTEHVACTAGTLYVGPKNSIEFTESLKGLAGNNSSKVASTLVNKHGALTLTVNLVETITVKVAGLSVPFKFTGVIVATGHM